MAETNRPPAPPAERRDFILIDPERHFEWVATGNEHARREGVVGAQLLTVTQPSPRWFAEAGLAVPADAVLAAFARNGIAVLRQVEAPSVLLYRPEVFAGIAVDAAVAEAERRVIASEQARTPQTAGASRGEIGRVRFAAVLAALDAYPAQERHHLFCDAFRRSEAGRTNLSSFETLARDHPDVLAAALDKVWRHRRAELEQRASIPHEHKSARS